MRILRPVLPKVYCGRVHEAADVVVSRQRSLIARLIAVADAVRPKECTGVERSVGGHGDGERGTTLQCHDASQVPAADQTVDECIHASAILPAAAEWKLVDRTEGKAMAMVEVRQTVVSGQVAWVLDVDTRFAGRRIAARALIDAAAPGICSEILQAMPCALLRRKLEGVVAGDAAILPRLDRGVSGVRRIGLRRFQDRESERSR